MFKILHTRILDFGCWSDCVILFKYELWSLRMCTQLNNNVKENIELVLFLCDILYFTNRRQTLSVPKFNGTNCNFSKKVLLRFFNFIKRSRQCFVFFQSST